MNHIHNRMNTQQQNYHRSDLHPLPMRVSRLQIERLRELRARDGLSVQEHVRRSIDQYLAILDGAPEAPAIALKAQAAAPATTHPTGEQLIAALKSAPPKARPKRIRVRQR